MVLAGQPISAIDLPAPFFVAANADSANLTTTFVDMPGCTIDIATVGASAKIWVNAVVQYTVTAFTSAAAISTQLVVDGVAQVGQVVRVPTANSDQGTFSQAWLVTVSPGTHTLKLQSRISAANLTAVSRATSSNLSGVVFDSSL